MQYLERPLEAVRFPPGSAVIEGCEPSGYSLLVRAANALNCGAVSPPHPNR